MGIIMAKMMEVTQIIWHPVGLSALLPFISLTQSKPDIWQNSNCCQNSPTSFCAPVCHLTLVASAMLALTWGSLSVWHQDACSLFCHPLSGTGTQVVLDKRPLNICCSYMFIVYLKMPSVFYLPSTFCCRSLMF